MPSPFPGMNPWLEHPLVWHGFHHLYLSRLCRQIASQISPRYVVDVDDNVYINNEDEERVGWFRPDLGVRRTDEQRPACGTAVAQIEAPVYLELPRENEERLPYLRITDADGQYLVTVVELLSPTNKRPGDNRTSYLNKRRTILAADVNLVEIDFLRAHPPMPTSARPPCAYSVLVVRAERQSRAGFWPIGLRDPLPIIPIPLKSEDVPARVDLRAALDEAYEDAAYQYRLYKRDPEPPLSPEDDVWARGLLPTTS
ncbi:DUF4058 family protein [Paludisphaera rhizosphaerae]|uniref:DUF4058 family protein n=1 Tax=Paludisphaera rhizosphaerae TaxID=2711216 RepID=UPI0013EBE423|nr:DUF4058 family protein [Paludisphaera rhizosphaerae]